MKQLRLISISRRFTATIAALALAFLSTLDAQLSTLYAQGAAFTYQGPGLSC